MKSKWLLCAMLASGCGPVLMLDVGPPAAERLDAAAPVQLAWELPEGMPAQYFFRFSMKTRGDVVMNEVAEGIVHLENLGGAEGGFRRLAIRRQELRRQQVEEVRGGTRIASNLRDVHPPVSPNFVQNENGSHPVSYLVDAQWRFGFREATPFHFVVYDSLTYLLPVLTAKSLAAGDEWTAKVPVIVGQVYNNNEFTLDCRHRLERLLRLPGGHTGAEVAFNASGAFDSSAEPYARRFSDLFRSEQRMLDSVHLEGRAIFDIEAQRLVWKQLRYSVEVKRSAERIERQPEQRTARTYWEDRGYRFEIECVWRLRRPGEAMPIDGVRTRR